MIRQKRIGVKVEETDVAVTGLGGVPALVNLAHDMELLRDVDALLPPKEHDRGYARSASVLDLMLIPYAGGAWRGCGQLARQAALHLSTPLG